jgi:hypothetical protein
MDAYCHTLSRLSDCLVDCQETIAYYKSTTVRLLESSSRQKTDHTSWTTVQDIVALGSLAYALNPQEM